MSSLCLQNSDDLFLVIHSIFSVSSASNWNNTITVQPFLTKRRKTFISPPEIPTEDLFLVTSYFASHPITVVREILEDGCMGRPPTSHLGDRPPITHKSPPVVVGQGSKSPQRNRLWSEGWGSNPHSQICKANNLTRSQVTVEPSYTGHWKQKFICTHVKPKRQECTY